METKSDKETLKLVKRGASLCDKNAEILPSLKKRPLLSAYELRSETSLKALVRRAGTTR